MEIHAITASDTEWVGRLWTEYWGSAYILAHGQVFIPSMVTGFSAWEGENLIGLVTMVIREDACEIITIDSFKRQGGVGSALLAAVAGEARRKGCKRLFLMTTNDNLNALGFYQKRGFRLCGLHAGAIDACRKQKPQIPLVGENDIPIHDELELEFNLSGRLDVEPEGEDFE